MPVEIASLLAYRVLLLSSTLARWTGPRYFKRFGLKLPERRILSVVSARGPSSVNEVSKIISIDKAWVSRTVPRLVNRGLLTIAPDPKNKRRKVLSITPKGASIDASILRTSIQREKTLVRNLTQRELNEFRRVLSILQLEAERMLQDSDG